MKRILLILVAALALTACANTPAQAPKGAVETIMNRKSVRSFTGDKISEEQLTTILKAAMAAPTAMNYQPWRFVVVTDDAVKMTIPGAERGDAIKTAAAVVIVCGETQMERKAPDGSVSKSDNMFWYEDCSAATENLLLAVEALDLGAVWLSCYPNEAKCAAVQAALGMPADVMPLAIVPIGVPAEQLPAKDKWVPEKVHYNKW